MSGARIVTLSLQVDSPGRGEHCSTSQRMLVQNLGIFCQTYCISVLASCMRCMMPNRLVLYSGNSVTLDFSKQYNGSKPLVRSKRNPEDTFSKSKVNKRYRCKVQTSAKLQGWVHLCRQIATTWKSWPQ